MRTVLKPASFEHDIDIVENVVKITSANQLKNLSLYTFNRIAEYTHQVTADGIWAAISAGEYMGTLVVDYLGNYVEFL